MVCSYGEISDRNSKEHVRASHTNMEWFQKYIVEWKEQVVGLYVLYDHLRGGKKKGNHTHTHTSLYYTISIV